MPINPGSYRVATEFQVDGVACPMYSATIELNAFSFASTLEVIVNTTIYWYYI